MRLNIVSNSINKDTESIFNERRAKTVEPTKIKPFGGSYVTMCLACHECRAKHTEPCEELWKSNECILASDKKEY